MTPEERQAFFDQNGYWPTPFVPRKISSKAARLGTIGDGESSYGPFFARDARPHFHRPGCKYIRPYLKWQDTVRFVSHDEAVAAGKKPCKTCRA